MPPDFSLQPVLDFRHNRVEALETELGQMLNARRLVQDELAILFVSEARVMGDLALRQSGEVDLVSVAQLRSFQKALEAQIVQHQAALAQWSQKVTEQQHQVVAARQEEEALLTLKKKSVERFQNQQTLYERRLQDDIYISQAYHHRQAR